MIPNGTKVKFNKLGGFNNNSVPDYKTYDEDGDFLGIIHGHTGLDKDYYAKHHAEIVSNFKGYYIIRFKDTKGEFVQVGFLPDKFTPVFTTWKERY